MKILFPIIHHLSFIDRDIAILEQEHEVAQVPVAGWAMLRCLRLVFWSDLVFCWFASIRFLPVVWLARFLGRKVVVVAGGYDVAAEPAIDYGNMRSPLTRALGRAVLRRADVVSSYSEAGAREVAQHGDVPRDRQRLIYLGFDPPSEANAPYEKDALVLTVARVNRSTLARKGLRLVARTAACMDGVRFVLAGRCDPEAAATLMQDSAGRLELPGYVSDEALVALYRHASVYLQPSYHEAFGCSVAEAMLWNCVPVVTDRCSLPEVVGPTGYYVPVEGPPRAVAESVRRALGGPPPGPETPQQRILRCFPSARREEELLTLIRELGTSAPRGAPSTIARRQA